MASRNMHRLGLEATRIGYYDNKEEAADDYSCAIFIYEGGIVIGGVHTINLLMETQLEANNRKWRKDIFSCE